MKCKHKKQRKNTWIASSRVGETITTYGRPIRTSHWSDIKLCIIGRRKAAVFPLPVWAQAIKSRLPCGKKTKFKRSRFIRICLNTNINKIKLLTIIMGMPCFWIGVGTLYPLFSIFSWSKLPKSRSLNDWIGLGAALRDGSLTLTGILLNLSKLMPVCIWLLNSSSSGFSCGI